jgi:hypothetical protein
MENKSREFGVLHVFTETNVTGLELIVCFEKFKWRVEFKSSIEMS